MGNEGLNKWADLLLDTGKRNNLINFKDSKSGTVDVIAPNFSILFQRVENSTYFEVFDPKLEEDENEVLINENDDAEDNVEKHISKTNFVNAYEHKLKKQQILIYSANNKPINALKRISKKAKTAIEETGVNIAYLTFGLINWTENENSSIVMHAPILLAPITIENESSISPYYIKIADDDMIVNPTFAFKLQKEYGINLPDFDDYENINIYFADIEKLLSKLKWKVSTDCKIGIFSFLKINMYKDLKDNASIISKNSNILSLLGESGAQSNLGYGESEYGIDLLDLHNVVDADSSQAEAIEMAKKGKSFVLQGPPGTGKSQTITNIISECLSDGKKVLFVSEKLAALNVVYNKLKNAGLAEFCLELHSHKANKKQVIEELCNTLRVNKSGVSDKAARELQIKKVAQKQLDDYANELHTIRPIINKTLYRIYEEISACRTAPEVEFVIKDIKSKGEYYIELAETALVRYVEYTDSIGQNYHNNVWYGYTNLNCSYESVALLKTDLKNVIALCDALLNVGAEIKDKYFILADSICAANMFGKFFNLAKDSAFITPYLLNYTSAQKALEIATQLQSLSVEIIAKKKSLDQVFDLDIFKLDGAVLHKKLTKEFNGFIHRIFSGEYKRIIKEIKLCKNDNKKPTYKFAVQYLDTLRIYQQKKQNFADLQLLIETQFGQGFCGIDTDFSKLITELKTLKEILYSGVELNKIAKMTAMEYEANKVEFGELAIRYNAAFGKNADLTNRFTANFDLQEYNVQSVSLTSLIEKCNACYANIDKLDNWCEFTKLIKQLDSLALRTYVDFAIENEIKNAKLILSFKKAFYMQWVDSILHDSPILLELSRIPHDTAIKNFKEKDELNFEINKAKIKAILSAQRPNLDMVAQGSAISILLREGEKKRKQKGVRQLLSTIYLLAQTLKPCFLMSPLSVSTFLCSDMQFDVVIFDEASQIFPQDAIGAVYRAKQLIVVGDSKQMPPSNFFNAVADIDNDDEDDDTTDFESILDLCSTAYPQLRLKWHYRSRFEQLISFSNKNFYANELVTFPASKQNDIDIGVDYYYVDGVFDRKSKTNRNEAERIVELVFSNIEKYPERSLGIVAFSMSQQNLIDKLIAKRRQQDPSKEVFFKSDRSEPFFVKNLETVQGDERDTIIFSVAYAKDIQDRLLLNFGPINREGGERRLNVAITRAKYNVQLVSSMHYTDIDLTRTKSVGAKLLREYLDYAENGEIALQRAISLNQFEQFDSEFEIEVCEFLREKGFEVDTQVGCSSFKIDLALKHPNSSNYVLAIECDGASYHSSKTARDRDRLRQDILERMGWKFYRIWSTDWFRNKRIEQERLLVAAKAALENAPRKVEEIKSDDITFEETTIEKHFEFPKYRLADVSKIGRLNSYNIPHVVRAILEIEAPISEEWLLKRIVHMFNRQKVTNVVRQEFYARMRGLPSVGIQHSNGFLFLKDKPIPMLRVPNSDEISREICYIAPQELALGIKEILEQNVTAEKSGLFKLIAQHLGFNRLGESILAHMEIALGLLAKDVNIDGEILSIKKQ